MVESMTGANEAKNTHKIFLTAFLVRLAMLVIIVLVGGNMVKGFVDATIYYDDYRYELGAKRYAEHAEQLLDVDAFTRAFDSVGDKTGHFLENPIDHTPLWYWIVCFLMYLTKTFLSVRLLNILLASLAVVYVYKFAYDLYGEKVARLSAGLLTFLPYPVLFSCFAYKDQLVMLITFYLLYQSYHFGLNRAIPRVSVLGVILGVITLMLIRGGLSSILFVICLLIAFQDVFKNLFREKPGKLKLAIMIIVVVVVVAILIRSSGTIIYKLKYYLHQYENTASGASISALTMTSLTQVYKLPFAYIFSMVMPIGLNTAWTSWYALVAHLNVLMTPVAVGAGLFFFKRKQNWFTYLLCLGYYMISIVTSLNIFRHYYSLIPLSLMFFSAYYTEADKKKKIILFVLAGLFSLLLVGYYIFKG